MVVVCQPGEEHKLGRGKEEDEQRGQDRRTKRQELEAEESRSVRSRAQSKSEPSTCPKPTVNRSMAASALRSAGLAAAMTESAGGVGADRLGESCLGRRWSTDFTQKYRKGFRLSSWRRRAKAARKS